MELLVCFVMIAFIVGMMCYSIFGGSGGSGGSEPADTDVWVVQLHRVEPDRGVVASWTPITVVGKYAAEETVLQLYSDNQWGGPDGWPKVTADKQEQEASDVN